MTCVLDVGYVVAAKTAAAEEKQSITDAKDKFADNLPKFVAHLVSP